MFRERSLMLTADKAFEDRAIKKFPGPLITESMRARVVLLPPDELVLWRRFIGSGDKEVALREHLNENDLPMGGDQRWLGALVSARGTCRSHKVTVGVSSSLDPICFTRSVERDWFDYTALIFNVLASVAAVVALYLALRAYRIAKEQGRKTFELEALREIVRLFHDVEQEKEFAGAVSMANRTVGPYIVMLPEGELPVWEALITADDENELWREVSELWTRYPLTSKAEKSLKGRHISQAQYKSEIVGVCLLEEVLRAIERRTR